MNGLLDIKTINRFVGPYDFLSNFYPSTIDWRGREFNTVEHAYQAEKMQHVEDAETIWLARTPGEARKLARRLPKKTDWDAKKIEVMLKLLRIKFTSSVLRILLVRTGDIPLIEGNTWGDTFWGVCKGKGANTLGSLLMTVRAECNFKPNDVVKLVAGDYAGYSGTVLHVHKTSTLKNLPGDCYIAVDHPKKGELRFDIAYPAIKQA